MILAGLEDLLEDPKGLTRNQVVFSGSKAPVVLYATPNPLQQRALDLLGVSHVA